MKNTQEVKDLAKKQEVVTVYDFLEKKRDLIARALPNSITPARLIGVFTMLLKGSPALMECSQASLVGAVIQTVQLGLTPGNIGHCHYIPFKTKQKDGTFRNEVQFIIGYRGMIELVNRSGKACILNTECVYSADQFQYEQGLNPVLRHIPTSGNRGTFVAVYCIAKILAANEKVFIVLNKEEVEKVKAASKAGASMYSPWATWFDEMAKKTAVKRICKTLPLSIDVQRSIGTDETIKTTIDPDMAGVPDQAKWEDAEVVKPGEEAPEPQDPGEDTTGESWNKEEARLATGNTHGAKQLKDIEVGGSLAEFEGIVLEANHRVVGEKKTDITDYSVEDDAGVGYVISKFGKTNEGCQQGAVCTFLCVKVGNYRGNRQYMAELVYPKFDYNIT